MTDISIRKMTDAEARECVAKINAAMNDIRSLVLELYEREGWSAMGYTSWRECVTAEFKQGQSYLYYQLEAAQIERNISTTVEKDSIPERQLRPLTKLHDPEKQKEAWQKAVETAPGGKVTAAHVAKIVHEMTTSIHPEQKPEAKTESLNLVNLKAFWNASKERDRAEFIKWIAEYFSKYIKQVVSGLIFHEKEQKTQRIKKQIEEATVDPDFEKAYRFFYQAVQEARLNNWGKTSKEEALKLVKLIIDLINVE